MKRRNVKRSYRFSLPSSKSTRESSGIVKKPAKINWFELLRKYAFYILLIVVAMYVVFFSGIFRVSRVDVQGPNSELSQDLESESNKYIKALFTGSNWLFIDAGSLKSQLQKTFTGQESITVSKTFPNRIEVKTDEQKSAIIWKTGNQRYVVSINGRSLSETKDQNTNGLPVVIDGSSIPVKVGDRVVSRDFVDFVLKLNDYFKNNKIEVEQIFVSETTSELNVKLKDGYIIKFNTSDSADSQIKSLAATLALIKSQNKKPSEYIDLRVTGKAFYK